MYVQFYLLKELFLFSSTYIEGTRKTLASQYFYFNCLSVLMLTFKYFNCLVRQNCFEAPTINFKVFDIKLNKRIKSVLPNYYYAKTNN